MCWACPLGRYAWRSTGHWPGSARWPERSRSLDGAWPRRPGSGRAVEPRRYPRADEPAAGHRPARRPGRGAPYRRGHRVARGAGRAPRDGRRGVDRLTERGPGARGPAGPSSRGDTRAPTSPPQATVPPVDLAAVRRTDAIIESLAARGGAGSAGRSLSGAETGRPLQAEDADPAVRLLCALIDDVDDPGTGATGPAPPSGPGPGPRRRGPRTIVALGVAGAVLASGGVAAAGGDADRSSRAAAPAPRS